MNELPDQLRPNNFAHLTDLNVQNCTKGPKCKSDEHRPILLDILKTLENRLQARGYLPTSMNHIQPLWFTAENYRNSYMWRQGHSLADLNKFQFWVNLTELARHRIEQLRLIQEGFYTQNITWGSELSKTEYLKLELDYIELFINTTNRIKKHIRALSLASLEIAREINPTLQENIVIILPDGLSFSKKSGVIKTPEVNRS